MRENLSCHRTNCSKFLLEIVTLVSSANDIVTEKEFILRRRSFMHIKNSKGPRIERWGTPCFTVPQSKKEIWATLDFTSSLCFLLLK